MALDPANSKLSEQQKSDLLSNISLLRDTIVYFTSSGAARGVSGHTGGPYDTVRTRPILFSLSVQFQELGDKAISKTSRTTPETRSVRSITIRKANANSEHFRRFLKYAFSKLSSSTPTSSSPSFMTKLDIESLPNIYSVLCISTFPLNIFSTIVKPIRNCPDIPNLALPQEFSSAPDVSVTYGRS